MKKIKDISSITTPIKFYLPDGSTQLFSNAQEALTWFDLNYADGYSMIEYTPTQGDSDHPIQLQEITVTANKPVSSQFQDVFGSGNPIWGSNRVKGVRRAWLRNPEYMQTLTNTGNEVGAVASLPIVATAYSISPLIAGAMNLAGAYEGLNRLTSNLGVLKTYNKFKSGDIKGGFKSLGGDVFDLLLTTPVLNRAYQFGKSVNHTVGNISASTNKIKLLHPSTLQILTTSPKSSLPSTSNILLLNTPSSGKILYGSIIPMASSNKTIQLDSPEANLAFIKKFNKWNRRYGYPMLPKSLAQDGNALNEAIKDRLKLHNTFLRGLYIDENIPQYEELLETLKSKGIEPTKDNALEYLATHYILDTGFSGRSGFYNIPAVKKASTKYQPVGTIYTSNGLDLAVGYANRRGRHTYRGVFEVRRPLSFEGSREDWVLNGDFPLFDTGNLSDKSNIYYQYELPYLMATGKAVPKKSHVNWDKVNRELWDIPVFGYDAYNTILSRYKALNRTPHIKNFGTGTPLLNYRAMQLHTLLKNLRDYDAEQEFIDAFPREILDPIEYNKRYSLVVYSPKVLDKFESIVNSRNYRSSQYRKFKEILLDARKAAIRKNIISPTAEEIKQTVVDAGVVPNKPVLNIGTSEKLRTSTINANPSRAFLHIIFTGTPGELGLELVRRVPYTEWKNISGSTAHTGTWYPGVSRKSKKNGGKIEYEKV